MSRYLSVRLELEIDDEPNLDVTRRRLTAAAEAAVLELPGTPVVRVVHAGTVLRRR